MYSIDEMLEMLKNLGLSIHITANVYDDYVTVEMIPIHNRYVGKTISDALYEACCDNFF